MPSNREWLESLTDAQLNEEIRCLTILSDPDMRHASHNARELRQARQLMRERIAARPITTPQEVEG